MYRPPPTLKCACGYDTGIGQVNLLCIMEDLKCPKCGTIIIRANRVELGSGARNYKASYDQKYRLSVDNQKVPITC